MASNPWRDHPPDGCRVNSVFPSRLESKNTVRYPRNYRHSYKGYHVPFLQLEAAVHAVAEYREAVTSFFGTLPAAEWATTLPAGHGTTVPTLCAELGDAPGRWVSWQHLQGHSGAVPVTVRSGKYRSIQFRFACNKHLRTALHQFALCSLQYSEWARVYYDRQRARGHRHHAALRALGAKWLKIIFVMWRRHVPYREEHHLATMARQQLRQAA